ncbi:hypothetical protein ACTFIW_010509 [Dictyostelium discoideum]
MTSTIGIEKSNKMKKNNMDTYTKEKVKKDKENGVPKLNLIKVDQFSFVDISSVKLESDILKFIENNKKLLDLYNGFVIDKHVEINEFINGDYVKQAYLYKGLVIINTLTESNIHAITVGILNDTLAVYRWNNAEVGTAGTGSIVINQNTCQQPDGQLYRVPQFPLLQNPFPVFAQEVNYKSLPPPAAMQKIILYFNVPTINALLFIQIYDRDPLDGGNFKAVAGLYQRNFSILYPSSIISFGSLPLSANDIATYNQLSNNTPITGYLYNNNNLNNNPNNPMFIITINQETLYNNPVLVGAGPLEFNLFIVKQKMDLVADFPATF